MNAQKENAPAATEARMIKTLRRDNNIAADSHARAMRDAGKAGAA